MKQFILIGLFLSLSVLSMAKSSSGEGKELTKEIKKKVNYPEFAKEAKLHGMVMVHFVVNSDGSIDVKEINASDSTLAKYVQMQLESIEVEELAAQGDHYVKFRFRFMEV
ncbi:MAG: energy transducer TonB [Cryomorphaceae bacterium]